MPPAKPINPQHLTPIELAQGLALIRAAPRDIGVLHQITYRPAVGARTSPTVATLTPAQGLVGDNWQDRLCKHTPDGGPDPLRQITLMGARAVALIARQPERWALAGDQLFVDLDLSAENLPPGTCLQIGSAVLEINGIPHTGCKKFAERFGVAALKFFNNPAGKALRLRGIHAQVVVAGEVRVGDKVTRA